LSAACGDVTDAAVGAEVLAATAPGAAVEFSDAAAPSGAMVVETEGCWNVRGRDLAGLSTEGGDEPGETTGLLLLFWWWWWWWWC
jgi:hypothetical protein